MTSGHALQGYSYGILPCVITHNRTGSRESASGRACHQTIFAEVVYGILGGRATGRSVARHRGGALMCDPFARARGRQVARHWRLMESPPRGDEFPSDSFSSMLRCPGLRHRPLSEASMLRTTASMSVWSWRIKATWSNRPRGSLILSVSARRSARPRSPSMLGRWGAGSGRRVSLVAASNDSAVVDRCSGPFEPVSVTEESGNSASQSPIRAGRGDLGMSNSPAAVFSLLGTFRVTLQTRCRTEPIPPLGVRRVNLRERHGAR